MGTHLRVLSVNFLMSTNMTGFRWFQKSLHPCPLDKSSLSIGRVSKRIKHFLCSKLYVTVKITKYKFLVYVMLQI